MVLSKQPQAHLNGHGRDHVTEVVFASNSRFLVSASHDLIRIWNVVDGKIDDQGRSILESSNYRALHVCSIAVSPDSKLLASGNAGYPLVSLWCVASGRCLANLDPIPGILPPTPVLSLAFAPDLNLIACGCFDRTIRLWYYKNPPIAHRSSEQPPGEAHFTPRVESWIAHTNKVKSVAFGHNTSTLLASASLGFYHRSDEATIRFWNTQNKNCVTKASPLESPNLNVHSIQFSPTDDQLLASACMNGQIQLWRDGVCIRILAGGHGVHPVYSVAFAPNGKILASGSRDETVRLWNLS